jgi:uncharacterized protein with HEPN domain
MDVHHFQDR